MAYLKVLSRHFPEGTEENHEKLSQDSQSSGRDLNPEHSEYEAGMLTTRPRCSVQRLEREITLFTFLLEITSRIMLRCMATGYETPCICYG
jgi:hypothetical protein